MTEKELMTKAWDEGYDKCAERVTAAFIIAAGSGGVKAAMAYLEAIGPAKNPYE